MTKQARFRTQRGQKRAVAATMIVVLILSVGVAAAYVQSAKPAALTFSAVRVGMITLQVPDSWQQTPAAKLKDFPAAARFVDPRRPTRQLVIIATQTPQKRKVGDVLNSFSRVLITDDGASGAVTMQSFSKVRTPTMAGIKLVANQIAPERIKVHSLATLTRDNQLWFAVYLVDTLDRDFRSMEQVGANDKLFNTILGRARIETDPRAQPSRGTPDEPSPPTSTTRDEAPDGPR